MVDLDATFGVQVAACADIPAPFVSISCVGDDCVNIGAPCTANANCGTGLKCAEVIKPESTCYKLTLTYDETFYEQQQENSHAYTDEYEYDYYQNYYSPWKVDRDRTYNLEKCRTAGNFDFRKEAVAEPIMGGCAFVPGDHLPPGSPSKLPEGFVYYKQADEESNCLAYTCASNGDWVSSETDKTWTCDSGMRYYNMSYWDDETDEEAFIDTFPFSYENTYNYYNLGDAIRDETAWRPMLSGNVYYLSSSQRELADFFSLAPGDEPFACVDTDDFGFQAWSMVRELFDSAGKRDAEENGTPAPKEATLSLTGVLGICLPSSMAWTLTSDDEIDFPYDTAEDAINAAFGADCSANEDADGYVTAKCVDADDSTVNALEWADAPAVGTLASSQSVVRDTPPITSGATVIGHLGCDGTVVLHPGSDMFGMQISATGFLRFIHWLADYHQEVQECRYADRHDGAVLQDQMYRNRFLAVDNLLYWLTDPVTRSPGAVEADIGLAMPDWAVGSQSSDGVDERLDLTHNDVDDTCTYMRWRNQGVCSATWKGISSGGTLIEEDVFLNFYVSKCFEPESGFEARVPEMYLECEGAGCRVLDGPIPCDERDDCPSGWACHALNTDEEDEEYIGNDKRGEVGEHTSALRRFKALGKRALGLVGGASSFLSSLTKAKGGASKRQAGTPSPPPPAEAGINDSGEGEAVAEEGESVTAVGGLLFGLEPSEMCENLHGDDVLARLLYTLAPGDHTWSEGKQSFCFVDFDYLEEDCDCNLLDPGQTRLEAWAEAQAEIDVPVVKLTQLYPWPAISSRADVLDGGASLAFVEGASEWLGDRQQEDDSGASTSSVAPLAALAALAVAAATM